MDSAEVPERRCGFELRPEDTEFGSSYKHIENWHKHNHAVCCWRKTWNDTGRCIWHADVDEKPVDELTEARTAKPERLDGVYLSGVLGKDRLSFAGCSLHAGNLTDVGLFNANLSEANLKDADLTEATLMDVDLTEANLWNTNLTEANLRHADLTKATLVDADLTEVDLMHSDLLKTTLRYADLPKANLPNANLTEADLRHANLTEANLRNANLTEANLINADFTEANLKDNNLEGAYLEDASLVQTDLRKANLENAQLYQIHFSDVRINSDTDFGTTCIYENPDELADHWGQWWENTEPDEAAVWTYRRLQDLHEKYALTERARHYHVKKKEAQKRRHREEGNYPQWFIHTVNGRISKHGESPWRVLGVSGVIIAIWSVLYLLFGEILVPSERTGIDTLGFGLFPSISLPAPLGEIATSIYFSTVTFTTLGHGDLQPATGFTQALTTVESFLGALLMAYLVFVLGRRTNW